MTPLALSKTTMRRNFERVYGFREQVAPAELDYAATDEQAEDFFARKALAQGLAHFARFVGASQLDTAVIGPGMLQERVREIAVDTL